MKIIKIKMAYYLQMAIVSYDLNDMKGVEKYSELYTKCLNQVNPKK